MTDDMMQVARTRADAKIDEALGALRKQAREIGEAHGIPEGIAGHSIDEIMGRMAWVPSMARDLRRACGQEMAKIELDRFMAGETPAAPPPAPKPAATKIDPSKIPAPVPVSMPVDELSGVTTFTIKALKNNGLKTVGDVVAIPDEHLLKMDGLAEKSLAQVRSAIAKAAAQ